MKFPETFMELLEERISFCNKCVIAGLPLAVESEFLIMIMNLEYLQKGYAGFKEQTDKELYGRYLLRAMLYIIELKQKNEIRGFALWENKDFSDQMSACLDRIFNEVINGKDPMFTRYHIEGMFKD